MPAEAVDRFVIRQYRPGDETPILELFARSFHQPRRPEEWRWKYERNPYGLHRISVACIEPDMLVGHYAGYPVRFCAFGRTIEANQIGDTMTAPSVRHIGRGPSSVLGRTAGHFYETFCEGRVAFNYGFNVSNIQRFSLRFLRSARVEPVAYRVAQKARLRPIGRLERWARGLQFVLTTTVDAEWDALFARLAPHYRFLLERDARYVTWRYLSPPQTPYVVVAIRKWRTLVGWLVFRIRDKRMSIGDLLLDPAHGDALEAALRHLAQVYPVESIDGWFPPRPAWLDDALVASGLERRPEPQDLSLMCVPFTWPDAAAEMARSLYYTMGDGDLF
ncbi:MAG TPA: GNAT family N-acetyltransferase [Thermoanaerobaculia bacterium]|nr:GNAT family N-acetyltransferase [Thermoanaerobaculia bacterium]